MDDVFIIYGVPLLYGALLLYMEQCYYLEHVYNTWSNVYHVGATLLYYWRVFYMQYSLYDFPERDLFILFSLMNNIFGDQ